jgi:hypothetical protein
MGDTHSVGQWQLKITANSSLSLTMVATDLLYMCPGGAGAETCRSGTL